MGMADAIKRVRRAFTVGSGTASVADVAADEVDEVAPKFMVVVDFEAGADT
jgi:hypothetical protein